MARSAIAPEISAGVMTANISWNITYANIGIEWPAPDVIVFPITDAMPACSKFPNRLRELALLPNASE